MADFPIPALTRRSMIGTHSPECELSGAYAVGIAAGATSANRAYYVPFRLDRPRRVRKLWILNGTVSGNIDVAIYGYDLRRLASAGSTAQGAASTIQYFDITDLDLPPGLYYWAYAQDNATGQTVKFTGDAHVARALGHALESTAFPLPATMTPASSAGGASIPLMGMTIGRSG